ncbi:MAG: glycosyltransferase [Clostridium sp.]|nr:glycosyltransferase [Clostridium sp.]
MLKNILIISSYFTGCGHKSITEALCEKFDEQDNVNVTVVDGFSLGGKPLLNVGKSYGIITRNAEGLWEIVWDISSTKPSIINDMIEIVIKDKFLKLIHKVEPDVIVSVHPNFNGSILNILSKNGYKIPVTTMIADLVNISPLWADRRANYIIAPTIEAKNKCIEYGISEEKIKVLGFPVRSRFYSNDINLNDKNDKPNFLIMSGGEGAGNMSKIANIILKNFDVNVSIVTGRNSAMKKKLERSVMRNYNDRVKIYGFMENVQELMLKSNVMFTRASPNVMMEAVACNVPLVLTGSLPGQEQGNIGFAQKYNLGTSFKNKKYLCNTIEELFYNDNYLLDSIKNSQRKFYCPNSSKDIVKFICSIENDTEKSRVIGLD